jgi:hypothetical protein
MGIGSRKSGNIANYQSHSERYARIKNSKPPFQRSFSDPTPMSATAMKREKERQEMERMKQQSKGKGKT